MKKWFCQINVILLTSLLLVGCGRIVGPETDNAATDGNTNTAEEIEVADLCGDCGHTKGTDACCAADGAKCESCGFHKGAPLCCKLNQADVAGKTLCGKCGEVKGAEKCCKDDAEVCAKCELNKGSPLCCKLKDEEE